MFRDVENPVNLNSPSNFLLDLSILYIGFCAFSWWRWSKVWMLDNLKGLRWLLICRLNYVYAIILVFVEKSCVSQQNDVPLSWICDFCAVFTFHSNEILHCSLNFRKFYEGSLTFFLLDSFCYFKKPHNDVT